jgi:5'-nucleotidase
MFGLTVASNPAPYVSYRDPVEVATEQVASLRDRVDVLIAVTHLNLDGDIQVAQRVPGIDLILGGHDHENAEVHRGRDLTPILKADANARTAYVHRLRYDTKTRKLQTESTLQRVNADLPEDGRVAQAVQRWVDAAFAGFEAQSFDPRRPVTKLTEPLDGQEASVRNSSTRLTELVAAGMLRVAPGTELAVFNAGSIRIDDVLPAGDVTEYDIIRTMPFGGTVLSADMRGNLLQRVLDQGLANRGTGGYLHSAGVTQAPTGGTWLVNGQALDPAKTYGVAINDFLLSGREIRLDFLTRDNPDVSGVGEHGDIRKALIEELASTYGPP